METFKLTSEKLFKDNEGNYIGINYNFIELESNKYEGTKDFLDYFPTKLLDESETIISCPDCADQGGLQIQYSKNGFVKNWRIDQSKSSTPEYLHSFMDQINKKIDFINS